MTQLSLKGRFGKHSLFCPLWVPLSPFKPETMTRIRNFPNWVFGPWGQDCCFITPECAPPTPGSPEAQRGAPEPLMNRNRAVAAAPACREGGVGPPEQPQSFLSSSALFLDLSRFSWGSASGRGEKLPHSLHWRSLRPSRRPSEPDNIHTSPGPDHRRASHL